MKDAIKDALHQFMRERGTKRGFLLSLAGAFFLYDNKFCSICDYQIRLQSGAYYLNGKSVDEPLFLGLTGKKLRLDAAIPQRPLSVDRLCLLFHVACGKEPDELLRGICFATQAEVHFALFSEPAIERIFLALENEWIVSTPSIPPDIELAEFQQNLNRDSMQMLMELYLHGENNKNFPI